MQTEGQRILVGSAWPAEWNCYFKRHVTHQTTMDGYVADGKAVADKVTPESRRKDLENFRLKRSPEPPVSASKPATATMGPGEQSEKE